MIRAFLAKISGRVQGVGFRYSCLAMAEQAGLTGWVKNCSDGSVEVWAEGPEDSLNQLENWLQNGPSFARVDDVKIDNVVPTASYSRFSITY